MRHLNTAGTNEGRKLLIKAVDRSSSLRIGACIALCTCALVATVGAVEAAIYRNKTPSITIRLFVKPHRISRADVSNVVVHCAGERRLGGTSFTGPIPINERGRFRARIEGTNPDNRFASAIFGRRRAGLIIGHYMFRAYDEICWTGKSPADPWIRFRAFIRR